MKFKKIEIDAFRAFESKEGGIFDFSTGEEPSDVANLVVICGPNGFGKTSFYDAIEWGMTNRISRLERGDELARQERIRSNERLGERDRQYILKNRNSDKDFGSVRIFFDKGPPQEKASKRLIRGGENDYYFKPYPSVENVHFKDILMSQHNIDAFLRVDTPDKRYDEFVKHNIYLKGAGQLFKNILELIKENDQQIKDLSKKSEQKKDELGSKVVPGKIVAETNRLIETLRKTTLVDSGKLKYINKNFSHSDYLDMNLFLIEVDAEKKRLILEKEERETSIAKLIAELAGYLNAKEKLHDLLEKEETNSASIERFESLKELRNLRVTKSDGLKELQFEIDALNQFVELHPKYGDIKEEIDTKKNDLVTLKNNIHQYKSDIAEHTGKVVIIEEEFKKITGKLNELVNFKRNIKSRYDIYIENLEKKKKLLAQQKEGNENQHSFEEKLQQVNHTIVMLQRLKDNLENGILDDKNDQSVQFQEQLDQLNKQRQLTTELEERLGLLKRNAESIRSINDLHNKVISFGKQYVNETKSKICPLCGDREYKDFGELIAQIEKLEIASDTQTEIAGEIKRAEEGVQGNRARYSEMCKRLGLDIGSKIGQCNENKRTFQFLKNDNLESLRNLTHDLEVISEQIERDDRHFKGKTIEDVYVAFDRKESGLNEKKQIAEKKLSDGKLILSDLQQKKIDTQNSINVTYTEIENLKDKCKSQVEIQLLR